MNYHTVSISTTTELTKELLNEGYSGEDLGFMVICPEIQLIYIKSESDWFSIPLGTIN